MEHSSMEISLCDLMKHSSLEIQYKIYDTSAMLTLVFSIYYLARATSVETDMQLFFTPVINMQIIKTCYYQVASCNTHAETNTNSQVNTKITTSYLLLT